MPHLDFTQPPFDVLSLAERQSIRKNTQIRYLAKDEHLPANELQHLYVVIKGQIEQLLDDGLSPLIWVAITPSISIITTGSIAVACLNLE